MLFLHRFSLLIAALLLAWLIIAMRVGGVVPEDFVNSDIPAHELSFDSWQIYGSKEWLDLARRLASENQLERARQAAYKALSVDPSNGGAFVFLAAVYEKQDQPDKAQQVFDFGWGAWPAKYYRISVERAHYVHERKLQAQLKLLEHDSTQWISKETQRIRATAKTQQLEITSVEAFIKNMQTSHQQRVKEIRAKLEKQSKEQLTTELKKLKTRYDNYR